MNPIELLKDRIAITETVVECTCGLSGFNRVIVHNQQAIMKALITLLSVDKPTIKKT